MYIDDELLKTIAQADRILPYIDMPLQHSDDTMLRRMSRRINHLDAEKLIDRMREIIPELTLRTTFITGFPGETEEQFQNLADFVRRHQFERMGVFTYSYEPDTPAAKLPDQIEDHVKEERRSRLMAIQQEIAFDFNKRQTGKTLDVIIDHPVPDQPGVWVGRAPFDAPDVDGSVFVTESGKSLTPGEIVPVEIVQGHGYDLVGVAV
jgi:ribosomal protein S12 methylthiotransferase